MKKEKLLDYFISQISQKGYFSEARKDKDSVYYTVYYNNDKYILRKDKLGKFSFIEEE